jgi:hypothetical protein
MKIIKRVHDFGFFTLGFVVSVRDSCCCIFPCPMSSRLGSFSIAYAKRVSAKEAKGRKKFMKYKKL